MRRLRADEVLLIWERAQGEHPLERTLTILAVADPGAPRAALARLPLGERNRRLLELHAAGFGGEIHGAAECPQCGARLEFRLPIAGIPFQGPADTGPLRLEHAGLRLGFRLPDSFDLAAAARCPGTIEARRTLVERCVTEAWRGETPVPWSELPEPVIGALARRMSEVDPQAELQLNLECAGCGHRWESSLDLGGFLWAEIAAQAKRLLREVHLLARAYAWSEADILGLSDRRRAAYLEMAGGAG